MSNWKCMLIAGILVAATLITANLVIQAISAVSCPSEDSCSADYVRNPDGSGNWVISPVQP